MLEEIRVKNLALIEDVSLELGPGMTVLTGETGAGKTALVGAIKLLIGERADSTLVRAGTDETVVEGRLVIDGREHVVRRRVSAEGRSRCTVDGEMASVGELADRFGPVFDLHGQHEHQALLDTASHARYLDRYAGDPAVRALAAYRAALTTYRQSVGRLSEIERAVSDTAERAEYLRFVIDEIERVSPEPGEDDEIKARMPALIHGEKLTAAAAEGHAALSRDGGAVDAVSVARAALARVVDLDPRLDQVAARVSDLSTELEESVLELREYAEGLEYDPALLDAAQRRLSILEDLQKKHGTTLQDVLATAERARADLDRLENGDEESRRAREDVQRDRDELEHTAADLISVRLEAGEGFSTALADAVSTLAMAHARFEVQTEEVPLEQWGNDGPQRIEFLYAPGADQPARPLTKIASGGELSRVMLALKGVLGTADEVPVLVFDEVDAGIGGATALSIGERLRDLATTHQVLVVTHLAQVASIAPRHLVIEKESTNEGVTTSVRPVTGEERVDEVARMLSGGASDVSRKHAAELLAGDAGEAL